MSSSKGDSSFRCNCEECRRLWHEYAGATTAHIQLSGEQDGLAESGDDSASGLDSKMEAADLARSSARQAVERHEATHNGHHPDKP